MKKRAEGQITNTSNSKFKGADTYFWLPPAGAHTHINTLTHTYTHTQTLTHAYKYSHIYTNTLSHIYTYAHTHTLTLTLTHKHTYTQTHQIHTYELNILREMQNQKRWLLFRLHFQFLSTMHSMLHLEKIF